MTDHQHIGGDRVSVVEELLERSSLGSRGARRLRQRAPVADARRLRDIEALRNCVAHAEGGAALEPLRELARLYEEVGALNDAEACLRQLAAISLHLLADLYTHHGRAPEGAQWRKRATAVLANTPTQPSQGDPQAASSSSHNATAAPFPNDAPAALSTRGHRLRKQGDVAGAEEAFRDVIATQDVDESPAAMLDLSLLLQERDDLQGAERALREAIATAHPDAVPTAMVMLAVLLQEQGEIAGAEQALRDAVSSRHLDAAPMAMSLLGCLLQKKGDLAGAEQILRDAITTQHPHAAPTAMVDLGVLLQEKGDVDGARDAFHDAIKTQHREAAPLARSKLGTPAPINLFYEPPDSRPEASEAPPSTAGSSPDRLLT